MLRDKNFDKIGEVGLVVFFNTYGEETLEKIHVISEQNSRQKIHTLIDRSQTIFDKLIVREDKNLLPFNLLSKLERPEFIIEMESYENQHKFWLHRYQTVFYQDREHGFIPQPFKNYRVSEESFTGKFLPWAEASKVSCLIL